MKISLNLMQRRTNPTEGRGQVTGFEPGTYIINYITDAHSNLFEES
jgi:hypothetical protein